MANISFASAIDLQWELSHLTDHRHPIGYYADYAGRLFKAGVRRLADLQNTEMLQAAGITDEIEVFSITEYAGRCRCFQIQ